MFVDSALTHSHRFVVAALVVISSCTVSRTEDPPVADLETPVPEKERSFEDALFLGVEVATLDFTLSPAAENSLRTDGTEYVEADLLLRTGDRTLRLPRTGIRLKGNASRRTLDQKAAFNLKFDKFDSKQRLGTLKRVALNNMVQDTSMLSEQLGYTLFREAGVPTQRTTYARVRINGELFGLYLMIESAENASTLERWFGVTKGSLYEGEYGADFTTPLLANFSLQSGNEVDLSRWVAKLDAAQVAGDDLLAFGDELLELDQFFSFIAVEAWLAHWDGYNFNWNNFYVHVGTDGRLTFVPWGIDQLFLRSNDLYSKSLSRFTQACTGSQRCRARLAAAVTRVQAVADEIDLPGRARQLAAELQNDIVADPRREYSLEDVAARQAEIIAVIEARGLYTATVEECVDPQRSPDRDGDGVPGCGLDCDDADSSRHPGAIEQCNLIDDNCDGLVDEIDVCPHCVTVRAAAPTSVDFCFVPSGWAQAELDCRSRGGHLVSLHSEAGGDALWPGSTFTLPTSARWIGANDRETEGAFVWSDESPFDFTWWAPLEPNNFGGDEHCVAVYPQTLGRWNDLPCETALPYYCSRSTPE